MNRSSCIMTLSVPVPLSVFIIAKDEEDRIARAIESVRDFADEVLVIDSGSSDGTVRVAQEAGARALFHDFQGYGAQKRFGEEQCRNRWLLNIDADEPLTHAARDEIRTLLANGSIARFGCWRIPIKTVYPHEDEPASWAFSYNQIRLYDREKARFSASPVHDSVLAYDRNAPVGQIEGAIAHRSHRSIDFQVVKFNRYASMQVEDMIAKKKRFSRARLLTEFPLSFLKAYFIRRHFLYGLWGFYLAMSYAYSRFLRVAKFYEAELLSTGARKEETRK